MIKCQAGHACADAEQDNADVFQGVVRQQTLNVVLHQRIQPADKGSNHTCDKQRDTPPQRRLAACQGDRQNAEQTDFHHHGGEQRGSGCRGIRVRLRYPAVQRDDPGQQAKAHHAQQPDVVSQWLTVKRCEVERAETLPHPPAGQRQQQRAEATERKPQLAGGATSRQEHAAERHDLRHHHQRAEVAGNDGADRRRHQQVNQQTIRAGVLMAVPVNIEQADKHPAQAKSHQPDGVQRRELNGMSDDRNHCFGGLAAE